MEIRSTQSTVQTPSNTSRLADNERLTRELRQAEEQAARTQQAREKPAAEKPREDTERRPATVNAEGQTVGTRVNTTA